MAWSASKVFVATIEAVFENAHAINLASDTCMAALYNNTTAPDANVALANTAYAVGQWAVANEVDDTTDWDTGGEPIASLTSTITTNVYTVDGANTVQGGTSCTLADVYGALVYDGTVAGDYGLSFNYFGGVQAVTAGTFTIAWHASGIFTITV